MEKVALVQLLQPFLTLLGSIIENSFEDYDRYHRHTFATAIIDLKG
jgi:hypothetical protein